MSGERALGAYAEGREQGRAEGAAEERARIVALLTKARSEGRPASWTTAIVMIDRDEPAAASGGPEADDG